MPPAPAVEAAVPNIEADAFAGHVETAKAGCPVSAALSAVPITVDAKLV